MPTADIVPVSDSVQVFKNGVELLPPIPPEIPTPQNIIGFRQHAVRVPKRAARAILIEAQLTNLVIAPLKLLAFSDGINTAIAGIKPRLVYNMALSPLILVAQRSIIRSAIKMQPEPMILKAQLALLSPPSMWATAKLKTRPETQSIHALKAVNFEKMYKLVRIMKVAMLAD